MDNFELSGWMWDRTVRVEQMFLLAGVDAEAMPDELEEFFDNHDDEELSKVFGVELPAADADEDGDEYRRVAIWEELMSLQMQGLLVQVACPVKEYPSYGGTQYSWGHYHTQWLYVESLGDDFRAKVEAFMKQCEESDRKESAKA